MLFRIAHFVFGVATVVRIAAASEVETLPPNEHPQGVEALAGFFEECPLAAVDEAEVNAGAIISRAFRQECNELFPEFEDADANEKAVDECTDASATIGALLKNMVLFRAEPQQGQQLPTFSPTRGPEIPPSSSPTASPTPPVPTRAPQPIPRRVLLEFNEFAFSSPSFMQRFYAPIDVSKFPDSFMEKLILLFSLDETAQLGTFLSCTLQIPAEITQWIDLELSITETENEQPIESMRTSFSNLLEILNRLGLQAKPDPDTSRFCEDDNINIFAVLERYARGTQITLQDITTGPLFETINVVLNSRRIFADLLGKTLVSENGDRFFTQEGFQALELTCPCNVDSSEAKRLESLVFEFMTISLQGTFPEWADLVLDLMLQYWDIQIRNNPTNGREMCSVLNVKSNQVNGVEQISQCGDALLPLMPSIANLLSGLTQEPGSNNDDEFVSSMTSDTHPCRGLSFDGCQSSGVFNFPLIPYEAFFSVESQQQELEQIRLYFGQQNKWFTSLLKLPENMRTVCNQIPPVATQTPVRNQTQARVTFGGVEVVTTMVVAAAAVFPPVLALAIGPDLINNVVEQVTSELTSKLDLAQVAQEGSNIISDKVAAWSMGFDFSMVLGFAHQMVMFSQIDAPSMSETYTNFATSFFWSSLNFLPDPSFTAESTFENDSTNRRGLQEAEKVSPLMLYSNRIGISPGNFFGYSFACTLIVVLIVLAIVLFRHTVGGVLMKHCCGISTDSSSRTISEVITNTLSETIGVMITFGQAMWYPVVLGPVAQMMFSTLGFATERPGLTLLAHSYIILLMCLIAIGWVQTRNRHLVKQVHVTAATSWERKDDEVFSKTDDTTVEFGQHHLTIVKPLIKHWRMETSYFWIIHLIFTSAKVIIIATMVDLRPSQPVLLMLLDLWYFVLLFWLMPYRIRYANYAAMAVSLLRLPNTVIILVLVAVEPGSLLPQVVRGLETTQIVFNVLTLIGLAALMIVKYSKVLQMYLQTRRFKRQEVERKQEQERNPQSVSIRGDLAEDGSGREVARF